MCVVVVIIIILIRDVWQTKILFAFGFKNQTMQKFDICLDGFLTETACSPPSRAARTMLTVLQKLHAVRHHGLHAPC